jgi:hypothetical protein
MIDNTHPGLDTKILVGILYCGENEWSECERSIAQQTLPAAGQFTLAWLPNRQAHQKLYETFESHRDEVDLFLKIDADMVLRKSNLFENIAAFFLDQPSVDHLEVAVYDHFLEENIFGLNCFRNTIARKDRNNAIFTDACFTGKRKQRDTDSLAPAADHCPDPSRFQSFHYGVHKAVKFHQEKRSQWNSRRSRVNWERFQILLRNWKNGKQERHLLAILGFLDAIYYGWTSRDLDFNAPSVKERLYSREKRLGRRSLLAQTSISWTLFLPDRMRKRLLLEIAWKRASLDRT